uniref:CHK domain-containing protein n=1 Tax=Angiostrongylus cantonensis TaxID=6313 RepID=A0A0K0D2F3_ANGCA
MELPEASKLAAFFNSKFFHETVTENRLAIPCGRLEHSFRIEDDDLSYLVFVVIFQHGVQKHQLSEHELCQVAEKIAIMHSTNTATMSTEFIRVIEENHENIRHYQKSIEPQLLEILREALMGGLSQYFSLPTEVMPRLMAVLESKHDSVEPSERVICHGNLTAEKCYFRKVRNGISSNRYQQELVDISEWENVHFGDVAFDLSNLIISSAEPSTRRNKYMTKNAPGNDNFQIFRSYYYSRVDRLTTKFNLAHLKRLFRKHHREVVLLGIEQLLEVLSSDVDNDVKIAHSYRWESALEDAFSFCTQDYVSDDEHCLFAN